MPKKTLFIILLAIGLSVNAQDLNRQKMDSLFTLIDTNDKGMGSITIHKDGEEVYQKSIGYADLENKIAANHETVYRIGSISKMFTATIIMQLVEEGKIKLDQNLKNFFPDVPNAKKITIEQLLRHQSGLFNFTNSPDYTAYMENPKSREEMLRIISDNGTIFEPGERSEYSNTNFILLAYIAEDTEGKPFSEILQERIAKPCGLNNTYYGGPIDPAKNEALSYTKLSGWEPATETDMSIPSGAGAVVSTAHDLNVFLNCLFTGKLVKEETLKQMMKIEDKYGIGMFTFPLYDKTAYGHTGGIDGFQSNAAYFPAEKVAIAYLSNGVDMSVNDILIGALSIYFGMDYQLPEFSPAMELDPEQLDQYVGIYSTPDLPLKITIARDGSILTGQGTGQPSFPLEAYDTHKFRFDQAGLTIEFLPDDHKLILTQGGKTFEMSKE